MNYKEYEPEENPFTTILADITHRCNMSCANCYLPNRDIPDMDIHKFYELIQRLPKRTYIRLIGAEPTMRDDLFDIIKNIRKLGHKPTLVTNGLKLASFEYCQQLKASGLRHLQLSMNGANDDDLYKKMDNGKYAFLKSRALSNILLCNMEFSLSSIIASNINENVILKLIQVLIDTAKTNNITFNKGLYRRITPILRFRSVGQLGRYIDCKSYSADELLDIVSQQLNIDKSMAFKTNCGIDYISETNKDVYSWTIKHESEIGNVFIRMTSWDVDDDGVVNPGNEHRGRITQDWKLAPFFEHIKLNEFGY